VLTVALAGLGFYVKQQLDDRRSDRRTA